MENYYAFTRTNYFKVKDVNKFKHIMDYAYSENTIEIWEKSDIDNISYAFGTMDEISFESEEYDNLYTALQSVVAPGDTIIITEIKYNYLKKILIGSSIIITEDKIEIVDI